jgi:hypothetical protein
LHNIKEMSSQRAQKNVKILQKIKKTHIKTAT